MPTHKDYIKEFIIEGKTDAALKAFLKGAEVSRQEDLYNDIILLMARNSTNEKNNLGGLIDDATYARGKAQINYAILSLLDNYNPQLSHPNDDNNTNPNPPHTNGGTTNPNSVTGNGNIIIGGVTGSNINIGGGGVNPPLPQNLHNSPDASVKKQAIEHIENGDFVEAFEILDEIEVGTKKMQYNRFKDEYTAGLSAIDLIDFAKRLKFFVKQLK